MPWYVVQTAPGAEKPVSDMIRARRFEEEVFKPISIVSIPFGEEALPVGPVSIPQQRYIDVTHGHREEVEGKLLPGYVLIEMPLIEEEDLVTRSAMQAVEGLHGVLGFLRSTDVYPLPLTREEAARLLRQHELEVARVSHTVGAAVRIIDGPFAGHAGVVSEVGTRALHVTLAGGLSVQIDGAYVEAA